MNEFYYSSLVNNEFSELNPYLYLSENNFNCCWPTKSYPK